MIKNLLLLISIFIILISYLRILLSYLKTKNIKSKNLTGFDIAKEITSNYNEINIVESKEINISKYNLKRRIIRLTNKNYEGDNLFTLAITSCLSGYSLANINKDKYIQLLSNILPSIDYLGKSSILALIISIMTNNAGDAKLAIILLGIILAYQYIIILINTTSNNYAKKELKKIISKKELSTIEEVLNSFLSLHTLSFITTLILILREILLIMNF